MNKISKILTWVHRYEHHLRFAEHARSILVDAQYDRGIITRALSAMSLIRLTAKHFGYGNLVEDYLINNQFSFLNSCIGGFLTELLEKSHFPKLSKSIDSCFSAAEWESEGIVFLALFNQEGFHSGVWIKNLDDEREEKALNIFRRLFWSEKQDRLLLSTGIAKNDAYGGYVTSPISDPGPYIGKLSPKFIADRVRAYGPNVARTIVFKGPSGVGKSVLARLVSCELRSASDASGVLRLASTSLGDLNHKQLADILSITRPSVFLVDDIDPNYHSDGLLLMLEALREAKITTILTMMSRDRSLYFEGLRPGRVDEIFLMDLPNEEERSDILQLYYDRFDIPKSFTRRAHRQLARETEGMTGAYIGELVGRLRVHGVANWKNELNFLLAVLPGFRREEELEENTADWASRVKGKQYRKMGVSVVSIPSSRQTDTKTGLSHLTEIETPKIADDEESLSDNLSGPMLRRRKRSRPLK